MYAVYKVTMIKFKTQCRIDFEDAQLYMCAIEACLTIRYDLSRIPWQELDNHFIIISVAVLFNYSCMHINLLFIFV